MKDTGDFIEKRTEEGKIPKGAIPVKADVVGLYSSTLHKERRRIQNRVKHLRWSAL